jgi:hypothetical protein
VGVYSSPGRIFGAISLGQLIASLERLSPVAYVSYDWWGLKPTKVLSYRGFYEDLALGLTQDGPPTTAEQLLAECRKAIGADFGGYKGGRYQATEDTGLWASEYGQVSDIIITALNTDDPMLARLMTKKTED